ncbi:small, acid-soluble spore protein, alpha/beta type [Ferviditalea candida]|uniref:Small, acid-soluble spore protein, alpha/beta type n=1 Tax=Ferviditalea candida TaxID=3108399 RepID=A0ABU5ZK01_9BACL|nr:small, acid-soluble spore protein, alpha/beta type [Paenibacillaceae bacterium T2]
MSRRRRKTPLVPQARASLDQLKAEVMLEQGYTVNEQNPNSVKYQVADRNGIPLSSGYNGKLTTEQAGIIGGNIGGPMVREMIKRAQESLVAKKR